MRRYLVLFVIFTASLMAQINMASITGIVTDSSGAVVPDTTVVITKQDTNVAYRTVTNAEGVYVIPSLTPGHYRAQFEASGFKQKVV